MTIHNFVDCSSPSPPTQVTSDKAKLPEIQAPNSRFKVRNSLLVINFLSPLTIRWPYFNRKITCDNHCVRDWMSPRVGVQSVKHTHTHTQSWLYCRCGACYCLCNSCGGGGGGSSSSSSSSISCSTNTFNVIQQVKFNMITINSGKPTVNILFIAGYYLQLFPSFLQ